MPEKLIAVFAALNMIIGVAAGAFGAHGLKRVLSPDMLAVWQTAVTYQMIHALGMFLIALMGVRSGSPLLAAAGWTMLAGIVMFSGSLYLLSLTGMRWVGPITPLGGVAFLAAWGMVAYSAWKHFA